MYSPIETNETHSHTFHSCQHQHQHQHQHHHSHMMTQFGPIGHGHSHSHSHQHNHGHGHLPGHFMILSRPTNEQQKLQQQQQQQHQKQQQQLQQQEKLQQQLTEHKTDLKTDHKLQSSSQEPNLGMDKSPMCLINELARANSIKHQYHLVDETGPPHEKTFTVVLKLGETEEFKASGPSIRKAQRTAAALALNQTKYQFCQEKSKRSKHKASWPLTPTVELNVLAMKRGESAVYQVTEPRVQQNHTATFHYGHVMPVTQSPYDYRGMHNQRYHVPVGLYTATVTIGGRQFVGRGRTAQSAKHKAAEEALKELKQLERSKVEGVEGTRVEGEIEGGIEGRENIESPNEVVESSKSPISLVHEFALKKGLPVTFDVVNQAGPSHLPVFITRCKVGDLAVTEGQGNGKKISKKNAAAKMLIELRKIEPQLGTTNSSDQEAQKEVEKDVVITSDPTATTSETTNQRTKYQRKFIRKKRTIIRQTDAIQVGGQNDTGQDGSGKSIQDDGDKADEIESIQESLSIHPINRLIQIQQAKKESEPKFTVISENQVNRRKKEFTIECSVTINGTMNTITSTGCGPNKKIAKKNAAESMLHQLGYSSTFKGCCPSSGCEGKEIIYGNGQGDGQANGTQDKKSRKVKFEDEVKLKSFGRQLVPGLILVPSEPKSSEDRIKSSEGPRTKSESQALLSIVIKIAKELLDYGSSPTGQSISNIKFNDDSSLNLNLNSSTKKLNYLADVVGKQTLQVHYSDFPKKTFEKDKDKDNESMISVVTITFNSSSNLGSNTKPIVSHGIGSNHDGARDEASHDALLALSKLV